MSLKTTAENHYLVAAAATKTSVDPQIGCCVQPLISWPLLMILPNGGAMQLLSHKKPETLLSGFQQTQAMIREKTRPERTCIDLRTGA